MRSANSVSVAARYPGCLDSSLLMSSCIFLAMGALCGALSGACAALHVITTHSKDAIKAEQSVGSIRIMQQHSLCKLAVVHVALKPKSLSHLSSAKSVAATIDKGWFGTPCCNTEASKA